MEQEVVWEYRYHDPASDRFSDQQPPEYKSFSEAKHIQASQKGDVSAFNQLVLVHQDSLYRWITSLVHDEALAEDVLQATLITAFKMIKTFRGGSFRSWVFTIARNRSFDELRQLKRKTVLRFDDWTDGDQNPMELFSNMTQHPEDVVLSNEQAEMIEQLVNCLSVPLRQVVRLIDLEGMDYQEAASVLGLPLGTVKSRLARARLKIGGLLINRGYDVSGGLLGNEKPIVVQF